jgi:hypothetical protein
MPVWFAEHLKVGVKNAISDATKASEYKQMGFSAILVPTLPCPRTIL